MIAIEEFCKRHNACRDGRDWALANCKTMDDVWATARPNWLIWVATRPGVLDDKTLRLFAVFCARSVEHLLTDQRSRDAIDVAERHAKGLASDEELAAAWASSASSAAAWAAACAAAYAAWDTAWDASSAAACASSASSASSAAARERQATWLREHCVPNFETLGGK